MIRELKRRESKRKVSTQPEPNLVISPDWPTKGNGDRDEDVDDAEGDAVADDADDDAVVDDDAVADNDAAARFSGCCPSQQQRHFRTSTIPVYKLRPCRCPLARLSISLTAEI